MLVVPVSLTRPCRGHGDYHNEEEEGEDGEAAGDVAPAVVDAQLARVLLQVVLARLRRRQLEVVAWTKFKRKYLALA